MFKTKTNLQECASWRVTLYNPRMLQIIHYNRIFWLSNELHLFCKWILVARIIFLQYRKLFFFFWYNNVEQKIKTQFFDSLVYSYTIRFSSNFNILLPIHKRKKKKKKGNLQTLYTSYMLFFPQQIGALRFLSRAESAPFKIRVSYLFKHSIRFAKRKQHCIIFPVPKTPIVSVTEHDLWRLRHYTIRSRMPPAQNAVRFRCSL